MLCGSHYKKSFDYVMWFTLEEVLDYVMWFTLEEVLDYVMWFTLEEVLDYVMWFTLQEIFRLCYVVHIRRSDAIGSDKMCNSYYKNSNIGTFTQHYHCKCHKSVYNGSIIL